MPGLSGSGRFVQMDIEQAGAEPREGETGGGGERAGSLDGEAEVGLAEKRCGQDMQIPGPAGQTDDFVNRRAGFSEFRQKPF